MRSQTRTVLSSLLDTIEGLRRVLIDCDGSNGLQMPLEELQRSILRRRLDDDLHIALLRNRRKILVVQQTFDSQRIEILDFRDGFEGFDRLARFAIEPFDHAGNRRVNLIFTQFDTLPFFLLLPPCDDFPLLPRCPQWIGPIVPELLRTSESVVAVDFFQGNLLAIFLFGYDFELHGGSFFSDRRVFGRDRNVELGRWNCVVQNRN